jgi:hypothetical protein
LKYLELALSNAEYMWELKNDGHSDTGGGDDDENDGVDKLEGYLNAGFSLLSSLEELNVDLHCLPEYWERNDPGLLVTVIPASVKTLTLHPRYDHEEEFLRSLRHLAEAARSLLPNLTTINFGVRSTNTEVFFPLTEEEKGDILHKTGVCVQPVDPVEGGYDGLIYRHAK